MTRQHTNTAELTAELAILALRELARDYDQLNYDLFGDVLRRPALQLGQGVEQLGLWSSNPPTITISRHLLTSKPWGVVVEVLKHEMAHQFVCEQLGVEEPAHGPVFRKTCRERGIDSTAAGTLVPASAADSSILHKISRLFALAASANKHEAEAAMGAAQRLMLKHNLSQLDANSERSFTFAHLGEPTARVAESQRIVAMILSEFFFVQILWLEVYRPLEGKRGSVLEICGESRNVELAEYVHSYLEQSATRLWREHQKQHQIRGNKDRRRFIAGVMSGFYDKLAREHRKNRQQGLIWLGDPELAAHFKQRYPHTRSVSYGLSSGSEAHAHGMKAGGELVLHRGVGSAAADGRPRLLKG